MTPLLSLSDALHLALHGPSAAAHELHAGRAGGFVAACEAMARARREGRRVVVSSWLTRSSCRSLVDMVALLAGYGVAAWAVGWPRVSVEGPETSRTVPRLGIAVPHALRALTRAQARGLPGLVRGVPLCVLGPFAARAMAGSEPGVYAGVCEGCPAREGCPGVEPWYLQRYGAGELRAIERVSPLEVEPGLRQALEQPPAEVG